jgi:hypothetical protein
VRKSIEYGAGSAAILTLAVRRGWPVPSASLALMMTIDEGFSCGAKQSYGEPEQTRWQGHEISQMNAHERWQEPQTRYQGR